MELFVLEITRLRRVPFAVQQAWPLPCLALLRALLCSVSAGGDLRGGGGGGVGGGQKWGEAHRPCESHACVCRGQEVQVYETPSN